MSIVFFRAGFEGVTGGRESQEFFLGKRLSFGGGVFLVVARVVAVYPGVNLLN